MDGLLCEISLPLLVDSVLRVLPQNFFVKDIMDTRLTIDTAAFNGRIGVGRAPWRSSQVTGILATIPFPYGRPSSSGLFMGCHVAYVCMRLR
jgi:hypothetical protein